METVRTNSAPQAIGPYSQGKDTGSLVFFSGQIAIDPATGKLDGNDAATQTRRILQNIGALLASRNLTFADLAKTTVFLTDMNNFAEVNAEYGKVFASEPPARSCVAVSALPMGALVEIEVIAAK